MNLGNKPMNEIAKKDLFEHLKMKLKESILRNNEKSDL